MFGVLGGNREHIAEAAYGAFVQPQRAVTERAYCRDVMGNEQNAHAGFFHVFDAIQALGLEPCIAHRERLIHDQNAWVGVHGNGKRQAHIHA
ncbi:hypothetical protein D3C84_360130 [compost metagenome]